MSPAIWDLLPAGFPTTSFFSAGSDGLASGFATGASRGGAMSVGGDGKFIQRRP
jgi:hypothetical protein